MRERHWVTQILINFFLIFRPSASVEVWRDVIRQNLQAVEVCAKRLRQLMLVRSGAERVGFTAEAELGDDDEDELRVFVSDVEPHAAAHRCGQ